MLDNVKQLLENDSISFNNYYLNYIMRVQDALIAAEFDSPRIVSQKLSPLQLLKAVSEECGRMFHDVK